VSLIDAAERFAAMDRSAVALNAARCLHSLDRNSECEACFALCPVHAIAVGKPPALDSERCEGCLACLTVCPVGAFSADDAVPALLNAVVHAEDRILDLVCSKNPQAEKGTSENSIGIRVKGCLAGLGTGAYVALAPFGLERIVLRTEACSACDWASLHSEIETQVKRARRFLSAWDTAPSIAVSSASDAMVERPLWNADNPPLSRRELFRMMARQGQVAMARAMENGVRTSGRHPGRDRLRLLAGEEHLPVLQHETSTKPGEFGFAVLTVTEACTACGACGRACPTDALKFEKDEDNTKFALKFSARLCVACDLCARVCAPAAVTVNHDPGFAEVFGAQELPLLEGELVKCKRCGALTAKRGEDQLCDLCDYRRTHPFGSIIPPGYKAGRSGVEQHTQ
jgi:Fe-S-cluster-containing hydrogenase component 2